MIADMKMRLFANGDVKNESNRIQLLRLTRIHVKTESADAGMNKNNKSRSTGDYNRNNLD